MINLPPRIGPYIPTELKGGGAFADVYLARSDSGPVVVKWLRPQAAVDEQYRESFYRELRLGRELDDPAILKVSDSGEWERRPFLVELAFFFLLWSLRFRRLRRPPLVRSARGWPGDQVDAKDLLVVYED